jgi:hypothetical protein
MGMADRIVSLGKGDRPIAPIKTEAPIATPQGTAGHAPDNAGVLAKP